VSVCSLRESEPKLQRGNNQQGGVNKIQIYYQDAILRHGTHQTPTQTIQTTAEHTMRRTWPSALQPQTQTPPPPSTATTWRSPQETCLMRGELDTGSEGVATDAAAESRGADDEGGDRD
jgi:hypothetical protein